MLKTQHAYPSLSKCSLLSAERSGQDIYTCLTTFCVWGFGPQKQMLLWMNIFLSPVLPDQVASLAQTNIRPTEHVGHCLIERVRFIFRPPFIVFSFCSATINCYWIIEGHQKIKCFPVDLVVFIFSACKKRKINFTF